MSPIRIVHVIDGLGAGGSELSLVEMLPRFLDDGFAPIVVCLYGRNDGVQAAVQQLGVAVRVLQGPRLMSHVRQLRQILREQRPALVHTSLFKSDIVGRFACAGMNIPVLTSLVSTPYDAIRLRDPNVRRARLRAVQFIDATTARHLTGWFHAVSHSVRNHAVATLRIRPDCVTVVERGRDPDRFHTPNDLTRTMVRKRLGLAIDDEVLLNVGRQEFAKGQDTLLVAFDQVLRSRPRAVLLVAGRPGHATRALRSRLAELPSASRIHLLNHRDDVPDLLMAADVFVFPSLYEGLPGAVIEAMAIGLPIVGSRIPAIGEIVDEGRNALLVPPARADLLAAAIQEVLESTSVRFKFAEHSRRLFLRRFTLERSAHRMAMLFRHVARLPGYPPQRLTGPQF